MDRVERDREFAAWYEESWPRLVTSLTIAFAGDADLAREAAAEACARALLHWRRIALRGSPSGWAFTVGFNHGVRHRRRRGTEERLLRRSAPMISTAVDPALPSGAWGELEEAVASLPTRQRQVVVLRYVFDLAQDEIARTLGIAPGTVASTLHQARARLRAQLADDGRPVAAPPAGADPTARMTTGGMGDG